MALAIAPLASSDDEKISEMPDAGALNGTERIPVIRLGSPNLNLSTNASGIAALAASAGGAVAFHDIDTSVANQSFVLPVAAADNEQHHVKAVGSHIVTVTAGGLLIDTQTSFSFPVGYSAFTFRWSVAFHRWLL